MNICTDILLFIIFLTDDISILKNIMSFIDKVISTGDGWEEISIPNNLPNFLKNYVPVDDGTRAIRVSEEKKELEKTEEKAEEMMVREFRIKDIYDWEDSELDEFNNKLIRMTSLLQILSKSLPCFEHKLLKKDKKQLIKLLYQLPNRIFMFWSKMVDESYSELIEELKLHPYLASRKNKMTRIDIDTKARELFSVYALNLLLNLYYVPVVNATGRNTNKFLCSIEYFDYSQNPTYQLEHLMMKEQITENDDFVKDAIRMQDEFDDYISGSLLHWIVRHGIITRNDKRENIDRLESKFFSKSKKPLLIERTKNKSIKE